MIGSLFGSIFGNILGGIIGNSASAKDREAAQRASERALAEIERLGAPPDLARAIILDEFTQEGFSAPQIEKEIDVGVSKVSEIQEAAEPRAASMAALKRFQEVSETGMTPEARAAFMEAKNEAARNAQARMQRTLSEYKQRGLASSGAELMSMLGTGAAAAAEESDAALRASASVNQSALQALAQSGQLGGQIRAQDFAVAREKAEAADKFAMQQFNERVSRQGRNVAAMNEAARYNLAQKQRISEANKAQRYAESVRQRQAERDVDQLNLQRAALRSGAHTTEAQRLQQRAGQTQQGWSNIFGGISQGLSAYGAQSAADDRMEKYLDRAYPQKKYTFDDGEDQ